MPSPSQSGSIVNVQNRRRLPAFGGIVGAAMLAVLTVTACSHGSSTTRSLAAAPTHPSSRSSSAASSVRSSGASSVLSPESSTSHASVTPSGAGHVVVVMLENHSYSDVIGSSAAPYLNSLAKRGANLTDMHAVAHPSQPNYVALFAGATLGVSDDRCPLHLSGDNLGAQLLRTHLSFAGYAEGLPQTGSAVCTAGSYARKHVPWADFAALPASTNQPFSAFPSDYSRLPTVSFVIPDLQDDMHDGTVAQGDAWVRSHLASYANWAASHGSLLVITWDEDDRSEGNQIPTIVVGAGVRAGNVSRSVTLYSLLRLLEDRYQLPRLGAATSAPSIPLT